MTSPVLGLLAATHGAVLSVRNRLYDSGRLKVRRLPRPVISVGNIAVGGTGKTPFVQELAKLLSREGYLVCILSRGYKGLRSEEPLVVSDLRRIRQGPSAAGDEPFLLARHLPGVSVVVGADRYRAGMFAIDHVPVHAFLLDDGFQHRRLHRDLDIALVDAADPWAGGLMPAGRLREPMTALRRAHVVGLTHLDRAPANAAQRVRSEIEGVAPGVPVFATRTVPIGFRALPNGSVEDLETLRGRRVLAFAGIARPEAFFQSLEQVGVKLAVRRGFPDHHAYTASELRHLLFAADDLGVEALVTTEKDAVRLPQAPPGALPIYALKSRILPEAPEALLRFIFDRLPGPTRGGQPLG